MWLSPSKIELDSIIRSLVVIFPMILPSFNSSILSHSATPSKTPLTISLSETNSPFTTPLAPILTIFVELILPETFPST